MGVMQFNRTIIRLFGMLGMKRFVIDKFQPAVIHNFIYALRWETNISALVHYSCIWSFADTFEWNSTLNHPKWKERFISFVDFFLYY